MLGVELFLVFLLVFFEKAIAVDSKIDHAGDLRAENDDD